MIAVFEHVLEPQILQDFGIVRFGGQTLAFLSIDVDKWILLR